MKWTVCPGLEPRLSVKSYTQCALSRWMEKRLQWPNNDSSAHQIFKNNVVWGKERVVIHRHWQWHYTFQSWWSEIPCLLRSVRTRRIQLNGFPFCVWSKKKNLSLNILRLDKDWGGFLKKGQYDASCSSLYPNNDQITQKVVCVFKRVSGESVMFENRELDFDVLYLNMSCEYCVLQTY